LTLPLLGASRLKVSRPVAFALSAVLVAALLLVPTFQQGVGHIGIQLSVLFFVLNWVVLAESFNMFAGLTGYVNFGHVVFYGVGGYVSAVLMYNYGVSPYLAVAIGGLACVLLAIGISLPTTRLKGAYFAIATLSINEAFFVTFNSWDAVGGPVGLSLPVSYYQPVNEYYVMAAVAVACVASMFLIARSRFGVALRAIRQQEATANSIGINAAYYKALALALSGFFAGLAGALAIWSITYIDPTSAFDLNITVTSISMAMLGGLGTVVGPVIGGTILYELTDYLGRQYPYIHLMILGVIIIAVVLVVPDGLLGSGQRLIRWARGRGKRDG
jgi:branched-chain amino acid transport system permease protein